MPATRLTPFSVRNLIAYNGGVAFTPFPIGSRNRLWVTDSAGTTGQVALLSSPSDSSPAYLNSVNGKLLFTAYSGTTDLYQEEIWKLWSSNGTIGNSSGTGILNPAIDMSRPSGSGYTAVFNGLLFFAGSTAANGIELWKTDGTSSARCW